MTYLPICLSFLKKFKLLPLSSLITGTFYHQIHPIILFKSCLFLTTPNLSLSQIELLISNRLLDSKCFLISLFDFFFDSWVIRMCVSFQILELFQISFCHWFLIWLQSEYFYDSKYFQFYWAIIDSSSLHTFEVYSIMVRSTYIVKWLPL